MALGRTLVTLLALATAPALYAGEMADGKMKMEQTVGDLTLSGAFSRATLPNQPVAGAFLTITNEGDEDDVLIAVSSPIAGRSEIHEMRMVDDTMKMRALPDGLVIPAGETVELKPGGFHVMFMELNGPLIEGETVDATLEFQNAGSVTVGFGIQAPGARRMKHGEHGS